MFIVVWRALAATAAALVLTATWFMASDSGGSAVTLAEVLEKTASAKSLHLRIQRAEQPADKQPSPATEAWSAQAEKLRVNHADGTYDIALKEIRWQIDEKANRAAASESPYYRAETKSMDLLPLLGLDGSKARKDLLALAARPTRENIGGKQYDVYRYRTIEDGRPVMMDARVDRTTQLLHSLETLVDRDGKRTPAVTLTVLGANQPVDENLFVVGDTLTEDGRIGKVTDVQGLVSIRPVMAERWTLVCGNILLKPGDWLRTDLRGANAAAWCGWRARRKLSPGRARSSNSLRRKRSASTKAKSNWPSSRPLRWSYSVPASSRSRSKPAAFIASKRIASCSPSKIPSGSRASRGRKSRSRLALWWRTSTAATSRSRWVTTR